ncbi:glycosyltransferase [candidate division TA06 bacterium]|nr:glycosyltransferase [candidate division TA06 bacterium]
MSRLEKYREIVGDKVIKEIQEKARDLRGKHILHINSTYSGGGVAEILDSLVPLMNDIKIVADWRIVHGKPDFFTVTKKFHNALQGDSINLSERKKQLYIQTNEIFSSYTNINQDCVIVHDPQPLPLIKFFEKKQPWIWRCHIDLSKPNGDLWKFLSDFIIQYNMVIISNKNYKKNGLSVEQRIVNPAIDPLSTKNKEISDATISKYLRKFGVPLDKPLITQISRFDKWKDPEGVIDVYKKVKTKVDCRLILCGNMASDDPEGLEIFQKTERKARSLVKKGDIILVREPASSNYIFINSLQRKSSVIIQKSTKEGFGLTVTEALWKGTPVVGSNVGGIPLQMTDGENGFLVDSWDAKGFAERIIELLKNPDLANKMGKKAIESVRKKFLITRLLSNYLDLFNHLLFR